MHAPLFGSAEVDDGIDAAAQIRAFLEVEAVLAESFAEAGTIPAGAAAAVADVARRLEVTPAELAAEADRDGNVVIPLVSRLRAAVPDEHAWAVHLGATSQDVVDSGHMVLVRRSFDRFVDDLAALVGALDDLAGRHEATPMAGRTLLRAANPITFGSKVAGWLGQVGAVTAAVEARAAAGFPVQLAGPVGTDFGGGADDVVAGSARRLGLVVPVAAWHTNRDPIAEIAGLLGRVIGAGAAIGSDVALLMQDEVGELRLAGGEAGGSSSMPHKRNPVDAVLLRAAGSRAPGLVSTVFSSLAQEHERAAGAWHAEWAPLLELLHLAGGSLRRMRRLVGGIEVDADRMAANLSALGDGIVIGRLRGALAEVVGPRRAAGLAGAAVEIVASGVGSRLGDVAELVEVLGRDRLAELVDPLHVDPAVVETTRRIRSAWRRSGSGEGGR